MPIAENCRESSPFTWTKPKELAAQLLAEDELTNAEIAAAVKISERQLSNWKRYSEFAERIQTTARKLGIVALRYAIAKRARRVRALDDRWRAMQAVIEARDADPDHAKAPGGDTGLLVRKLKAIGSGENARVVEEFEFDAALVKAMNEAEKQAAQELGQWVEKLAPTNPSGADEYQPGEFEPAEVEEVIRKIAARMGIELPESDQQDGAEVPA